MSLPGKCHYYRWASVCGHKSHESLCFNIGHAEIIPDRFHTIWIKIGKVVLFFFKLNPVGLISVLSCQYSR